MNGHHEKRILFHVQDVKRGLIGMYEQVEENYQIHEMLQKAKYWIDESYKYPMNEKAVRRCCENAKSHLTYVLEILSGIEHG